jgi:hypothetical protein
MISCSSCSYENDDTRVFCKNCGLRLIVAGEAVPAAQQSRDVRTRLREAPARRKFPLLAFLQGCIREVVLTGLFAFVLAVLVQAIRPPEDVPMPVEPRPASASLLAAEIQAATSNAFPRSVAISAEAANNFLACRVSGGQEEPGFFRARLARAYMAMGEGTATLGVEQRLGTLPVYLHLGFRPVSAQAGAELVNGGIGRLPIPKPLLPYFANSFTPVLDALSAPIEWLSTASSVVISGGEATVGWPGTRASP